MSEPVPVRVRDCACPGTPHGEGDIVFLAPTLSLAAGLQADSDIVTAGGRGELLAKLWRVTFVRYGAVGWNWLDADGPVPFDVNVLLDDYTIGLPVSEKADELYGEAVMRPLFARLKITLPRGPTGVSTLPPLQSIRSPRKPSSPATSAASRRRAG